MTESQPNPSPPLREEGLAALSNVVRMRLRAHESGRELLTPNFKREIEAGLAWLDAVIDDTAEPSVFHRHLAAERGIAKFLATTEIPPTAQDLHEAVGNGLGYDDFVDVLLAMNVAGSVVRLDVRHVFATHWMRGAKGTLSEATMVEARIRVALSVPERCRAGELIAVRLYDMCAYGHMNFAGFCDVIDTMEREGRVHRLHKERRMSDQPYSLTPETP